jgi:hypothetical protein
MALVKGTNCFVDLASAIAYFKDRVDTAAWDEADGSTKSRALVSATDILDRMSWAGIPVDPSQPLSFPRTGYYQDPKTNSVQEIVGTPERIEKATFELALHLLANEDSQASSGEVDSLTIGTITLTGLRSTPKTPKRVLDIVRPLLLNQGSRSWWRAN